MNNLLLIGKQSSISQSLIQNKNRLALSIETFSLPRVRTNAKNVILERLQHFSSTAKNPLILSLSHPKANASQKELTIFIQNLTSLFESAKKVQIPLIYISSRSCHDHNPSKYSMLKLEFEHLARQHGHHVLRIGIYLSQTGPNRTLFHLKLTARVFRLLYLHGYLAKINFYTTKDTDIVKFANSFFTQTQNHFDNTQTSYCGSINRFTACEILLHPDSNCKYSILGSKSLKTKARVRVDKFAFHLLRRTRLKRFDPLLSFLSGHQ